jgi:hypothetical protein
MGFLSDVKKAVDDYSRKHKEHMTAQWVGVGLWLTRWLASLLLSHHADLTCAPVICCRRSKQRKPRHLNHFL